MTHLLKLCRSLVISITTTALVVLKSFSFVRACVTQNAFANMPYPLGEDVVPYAFLSVVFLIVGCPAVPRSLEINGAVNCEEKDSKKKMSRVQSRRGRVAMERMSSPLFHGEGRATEIHAQIIKQARQSGNLNLTNRGFISVPDQVWNINNLTQKELKTLSFSMDETDDRWWDQVDLSKLNLANNQIAEISSDISNLGALLTLDLHDNKLKDLPESFGDLVNLTRLDISHNLFDTIPECVYLLKDLRCLLVQNNQLKSISEDIASLHQLEELNLSHNQLKEVPINIGFLTSVRKFHLCQNTLAVIPHEIGSMTGLQMLDLSNNCLSSLPLGVGELNRLEQLYLRHNHLTSLPVLQSCANLKDLYCGNNKIKEISREHLEPLFNLKILELRDNRLETIPDEIILLTVLERLDVTNNQLTSLPNILGIMPHINSLSLDGNPLKSIRRDVMQRGTTQILKFLQSRLQDDPDAILKLAKSGRPLSGDVFGLAANQPGQIQLDQFTLRQSRLLSLSNKQMRIIPDHMFVMAGECEVSNVVLSKNLLIQVPESLTHVFDHLKELDLGFNQLSKLPSFIGKAIKLMFLDLQSNQLEALPPEIAELQQLREICIAGNRLKEIPPCLYSLPKLEILIASDNKIQLIDVDGLSSLSRLAVLDLKNNDISKVPPELGQLKQLRSLQLEGNTFRQPRANILTKGTDAILSYLRDRIAT